MSKQKQTMVKPQRFSGPELSELLDRVVSELGPSAEISAVNKIRSGGVGGFFCREEFEIIAAVKPDPKPQSPKSAQAQVQTQAQPHPAPEQPRRQPAVTGAPTIAAARADSSRGPILPAESEPQHDQQPQPHEPNRQELQQNPSGPDGASEVFGGPRPRATNGTDARFMALLERRLDEASETEAQLVERRARRPKPQPSEKLPIDEPQSHALTPARPAAENLPHMPETIDEPEAAISSASNQNEPRGFWARINKTRQELTTFMPAPASFVAVIGPLSLTTPVVRRLRTEQELAAADVVVLTDRAEIVSEPTWQLVRSGHQLVDVAKERADWPTILVIDVPIDLPQWLAPLQHRLRLAGVGVFRYAVPGSPSAIRLDHYRSVSDVPYVLDLVSRVHPERVVNLIAERHPVGSVGGTSLTPELLVAMREQVHGG